MEPKLIFVYGTLKSGYGNNRLITACPKSRLITLGMTQEDMLFYNSSIPFMMRGNLVPNNRIGECYYARVIGEVYRIESEKVLQNMDWLEGHPNNYRRERVSVLDYLTGLPMACEAYFYQHLKSASRPNYVQGENYYHVWPGEHKMVYDYTDNNNIGDISLSSNPTT